MNSLTLSLIRVPAMPLLSWIARADFPRKKAEVQHGDWVETGDNFVVDGAWSGDFENPSFHNTDCFFGSGLILDGDALVVVPSTATTDFCYYRFADGVLTASNSLPLLLAALADELDPHNPEYEAINHSIKDGIDAYRRVIPTRGGSVCRLMHNNLHVDARGAKEVPKPMPPEFGCFDEYRRYLSSRTELLFRNARSQARARPFQVYSTQSKGYDTTAINALAAPFGIDKVFTCPETKEFRSFFIGRSTKSTNTNDDGTPICEILNLRCYPIDRRSVLTESRFEIFFHAALHQNQDLNFLDIFHQIQRPTLLMTGILGDLWYDRKCVPAYRYELSDQLKRLDLGGHGLGEVRLHVGFVDLPLPFIGARRRTDVKAIGEAASMDPWRIGGTYDRPIARRIGEEAGVPRELFGQQKMATIVHIPLPAFPFDAGLKQEFQGYLTQHRLLSPWQLRLTPVIHRINNVLYWYKPQQYFVDSLDDVKNHRHRWRYRIGYMLNRCYAAFFRRSLRPTLLWKHLNASLYCFAVNTVAHRVYEKALPSFAIHERQRDGEAECELNETPVRSLLP